MAGCIWADDSSWKIQTLDLAEADRGILKRQEIFGYVELPEDQSLREAINMSSYGDDTEHDYKHHIRINIMQTFDLRTGKIVDPLE